MGLPDPHSNKIHTPWAHQPSGSMWGLPNLGPGGIPAPWVPATHGTTGSPPWALLGPSSRWDHRIPARLGSLALRPTAPQAQPSPSSMWDCQINVWLDPHPSGPARPQLHVGWLDPCPTIYPTHRPLLAPALQACQIAAPPGPQHTGCHRRAPNLPKRHRQTGLNAKGTATIIVLFQNW
jgi:hypothetical protein